MSKSRSLESIVAQAQKEEKRYHWAKAKDLYERALHVVGKRDLVRKGEIQERVGFCLRRGAMQAESRAQFEKTMRQAIRAYEKAQRLYERLGDEQKARRLRCGAIKNYISYWLSSDAAEKRRLLDECLNLEENALTAFWNSGNGLEYGRTFNELSQVVWHRSVLEWDRQTLRSTIERGMEWAEKAVQLLTEIGDSYEIARAFLGLGQTRMCDIFGYYFIEDPQKQEQHRLRVIEHMREAIEFSREAVDAFVVGLCHLWLGLHSGAEESARQYQKSLEYGEETRDNYLQATALDLLAYITHWGAFATEDPDRRRNLAERAMRFYDQAQHHFSILSYQSPRWGALPAPAGYAEHYLYLAEWETDPQKKLELLVMSEKTGIEALSGAEDSDLPLIIGSALHVLSKTLEARARLEQDPEVKRSLLERALEHRERAIEITERLTPYDYWDQGVERSGLATINVELSSLGEDLDRKKNMLEEAASHSERSLGLIAKAMPYMEEMGRTDLFSSLYRIQDSYVIQLSKLHELTKDASYLEKAIRISERAIESASKLDIVSLMAESYWKIARAQDTLGEHTKAAESFKRASANYMNAAKKLPQLKDFYEDHASYMQAWSEIEKAKHSHIEKRHGQAKVHYVNAANLHKSTGQWSYLTVNYLAWAQLEEAEDMSRKDQAEEAMAHFREAANSFAEAETIVGAALARIEIQEERKMANELVKALDTRQEYCLGRIDLEEAKILDRKGEHQASSRKYRAASERFQKAADATERESDRKELRPIILLCRAWQTMTMAEAGASPDLYAKASWLFEKATQQSTDEEATVLALGHSSFCRALEAGTLFERTRDAETYSKAKRFLEAAENYYLKAGFKKASEYAKATHQLLDAYIYIHKAETEIEPRRKAQYYGAAEKLLQSSAGSYIRAKHPEKDEQVRRLLESVREKRALAVSLIEVLHAPMSASSTASFSTPTQTYEKAVGLERFEHANIEVNLTAPHAVAIGGEAEFRLDLVNTAKNPGMLVRVNGLVPSGFRVTEPPVGYSLENGSIDMKGRKLDSLKVSSIRLRVQATRPGPNSLAPQVIYVDEVGQFRTSRPKPVTVIVQPKLGFEFETKVAQNAFDFLIDSFVEDYMRRRIVLERSGWRTLMQIVKAGKVPRSSVYGAKGRRGRAISELERRGLVETRIFPGERGRGGRILKVRIFYEKEPVKRHIDQQIMKKGKKQRSTL